MAIPSESQIELFPKVVDESAEVWISPPVLDAVIVVGQTPPTDPKTMLFVGYEGDILKLRTVSGINFEVGEVVSSEIQMLEQVLVGYGLPGADGEFNKRIYMDGTNKGIYMWEDDTDPYWTDPQVVVGNNPPVSAEIGKIYIHTGTRSILQWRTP